MACMLLLVLSFQEEASERAALHFAPRLTKMLMTRERERRLRKGERRVMKGHYPPRLYLSVGLARERERLGFFVAVYTDTLLAENREIGGGGDCRRAAVLLYVHGFSVLGIFLCGGCGEWLLILGGVFLRVRRCARVGVKNCLVGL